jgi:preprotein translocase subunit SecE
VREVTDKEKKPNRIVRWWRETLGELHKVSWPTPAEAWRMTRLVLLVMGVMSIVLFLFDFGFSKLVELLIVSI